MAGYSDVRAAQSIQKVIADSRWEGVAFAKSFLAMSEQGVTDEEAARIIFETGARSLKASREIVRKARKFGFLKLLQGREKTGSAENL